MTVYAASAISTVASAIATAILMYATYHWPAGRNRHTDEMEEAREAYRRRSRHSGRHRK